MPCATTSPLGDCSPLGRRAQAVVLPGPGTYLVDAPLAIGPNPPTLPAGWERQISNTGTTVRKHGQSNKDG